MFGLTLLNLVRRRLLGMDFFTTGGGIAYLALLSLK
jgi:hypothetical protein